MNVCQTLRQKFRHWKYSRLTSSSSLAWVCSILLKVVSPAFTMAVDKV